jgi:cell division protein FtsN
MKTLFYTIVIIFISLISFGQVTIQTNLPASIAPNSNLNIEIKITKGSISNFSKYQMDVPAGVIVTEGNSKTGNFSFEGNRAKIVWVSIPTEDEFVVSFKMNVGALSGPAVFNQRFFYVDNGTKKEVEMDPINSTFDASGATVANSFPENNNSGTQSNTLSVSNTVAVTPTVEVTSIPTNTTVTVAEPTVAASTDTNSLSHKLNQFHEKHYGDKPEEKPVVSSKPASKPVKETPSEKPEPNSNIGLVFKIQIGAFGADPGKSKFKALGNVNVNSEGGMYKVLYGKFGSKEEALKKLDDVKAKGFDGFVVKYQDGVRVK